MKKGKYIALCYHYIRSREASERYPRIIGHTEEVFRRQISMLRKQFSIISPEAALFLSCGSRSVINETGILFTFDDGLSDHFLAAKILAKNNIRALFFLPSCVFVDNLPANPIIIHYGLAVLGIRKFIELLNQGIEKLNIDTIFDTSWNGINIYDSWDKIAKIKQYVKYDLLSWQARDVLLYIYNEGLCAMQKNILMDIHLSEAQVYEMLDMGHTIGAHSHTHISVRGGKMSDTELMEELVQPKHHLENLFGVDINAFSYPFGQTQDCLTSEELIHRTRSYDLAFTIEPVENNENTNPLELGRYMLSSGDDEHIMLNRIEQISRQDALT